eukprot:84256-Rhodomonas_salina.4
MDRHREGDGDGDRRRKTETATATATATGKDTDTGRQRETERDTERQQQRERERERERGTPDRHTECTAPCRAPGGADRPLGSLGHVRARHESDDRAAHEAGGLDVGPPDELRRAVSDHVRVKRRPVLCAPPHAAPNSTRVSTQS